VVGATVQKLTGGGVPTFGLARYLVTPGCRVPDVRRQRLAAAKRVIVHAGCSVGRIVRTRSNRVPRGRVVSQRPRPGAGLAELGQVSLVVSKGRR
jgi:beta-lactam-binding protein with PASTA domain